MKQDVEIDKTPTFENSTYRTRWTGHVERIREYIRLNGIDNKLYVWMLM